MQIKKRDLDLGILLAIVFAINSISTNALDLQSVLEPFTLFRTLIGQGKLILFLTYWFGATLLVSRILKIFGGKISEKTGIPQGESRAKFPFAILLSAIITFYPVIGPAIGLSKDRFSLSAWFVLGIAFAIAEIIQANIENETGKITSKEIRKGASIFAFVYFVISAIGAPFSSLIKGSNIFAILLVHGFVGGSIFVLGQKLANKEEKKEKAIEEAKVMKKLEEEREYQKNQSEITHQRNLELRKLEIELEGKKSSVKNLQTMGVTQFGNVPMIYPELLSVAQAIPKEDELPISIMENKIYPEEEIKKIQDKIRRRNKVIRYYKEKYGATKAGQESLYLLNVIKELSTGDQKKWIEYVSDNGGKTWNICKFADKIKEFGNPDSEKWEKTFRDSVYHGSKAAIKEMKKRLLELQKQRNTMITKVVDSVEKLIPVEQTMINEFRKYQEQSKKMNDLIAKHNQAVLGLNKNLAKLRSGLKLAATQTTPSEDRRTLLINVIPTAFANVMVEISETEKYKRELQVMFKDNSELITQIEAIQKKAIKLTSLEDWFRNEFGALGNKEELEEVAA